MLPRPGLRRLLKRLIVSASTKPPPYVTTAQYTGIHTIAAARIRHRHLRRPLGTQLLFSSWTIRTAPNSVGISTMSPQALKKGQRSLPALFVRSGTSTGLVLRASDLPPSTDEWADILPAAMGSPDPLHGRQLDGMGGGISSTSKICVLAPSKRGDADVDFTFVQVGVRDGRLDLAGNCGNMSAVVGPVAWDWGFVSEGEKKGKIKTVVVVRGEKEEEEEEEEYSEALVRIFNTNTSKIMHARFRVQGEPPVYCPAGQYSMDGVPGTQSRITLSFVDPAGAKTGRALPTGNAVDVLELPDGSTVRASLVDVSNPGVFVALDELGLGHHHHHHHISPDTFHPAAVEADEVLKERLEMIRRAGAALMGLDPEVESVPKIVLLFPRNSKKGHSGDKDEVDIRCLAMSMGQAHKAAPLTLALCLGAAANIDGTVAAQIRRRRDNHRGNSSSVVIGHPSGTVEIGATFEDGNIVSADLHRTARVLMKGEVYY